jgi:superoxide dismutase, Fe-Mn family
MAELARYKCTGCQWIYDPRYGDAANEVPRGVPFEKLPATFICGVCGCPKAKFTKIEEGPAKKEAPKKKK